MNSGHLSVLISPGKNPDVATPKNQRLADVAKQRGHAVEVIDYAGIEDPEQRVQRLLASASLRIGPLVLVGVSMGGYVATVAAEKLAPKGLFLFSPALYLPPYSNLDPQPIADRISVVHAWNDQIVPVENSIRFAQKFRAALHLMDGDHSLVLQLPEIANIFGTFLDGLNRPAVSTTFDLP